MVDVRGIWRGKMSARNYQSYCHQNPWYPCEIMWSSPPNLVGAEPSMWFGLQISSQFEYKPGVMIISGEAGHFSGSMGDLWGRNLPVNGFVVDDPYNNVHLTFLRLTSAKPANFLGYTRQDNSHVSGDWTEARQWSQWGSSSAPLDDTFDFGKMSLQKMLSFRDSVELSSVRHLFVP